MGERIFLRFRDNAGNIGPWIYCHQSWGFHLVSEAFELLEKSEPLDINAYSHILEETTTGEIRGFFDMTIDNMDWGVWELNIDDKVARNYFNTSHGYKELKPGFYYKEDN